MYIYTKTDRQTVLFLINNYSGFINIFNSVTPPPQKKLKHRLRPPPLGVQNEEKSLKKLGLASKTTVDPKETFLVPKKTKKSKYSKLSLN